MNPTSIKVYLAGKIEKLDWRHGLFNIRSIESELTPEGLLRPIDPPPMKGRFVYAGPYFTSCDHGCSHGEGSHGLSTESACSGNPTRPNVVKTCLHMIDAADVVFAWIDDPMAYGTIAEIGYAVAKGKRVFVYMPEEIAQWQRDMWFAAHMASYSARALNYQVAWTDFSYRVLQAPAASGRVAGDLSPELGRV